MKQRAGLELGRQPGETFLSSHLLLDELGETFPVEGRDVFPVGHFQESVSNRLVVKLGEKKHYTSAGSTALPDPESGQLETAAQGTPARRPRTVPKACPPGAQEPLPLETSSTYSWGSK